MPASTTRKKKRSASQKESLRNFAIAAVICVAAIIAILAVTGVFSSKDASEDVVPAGTSAVTETTGPVRVAIDIQNYGTIEIELYPDIAPLTVANFLKYVDQGFYNGLTFHRIINGFMMQGGRASSDSVAASLENLKGEFSDNGVANSLSHTRGVISMARASAYDSATSQFFIMHQDGTHLDGQYAAFGRVTSGMEVVDAICQNTPVTDSNGTVPAEYQPVITSIYRITDTAATESSTGTEG